jgi:Tfp pilus assembly protein PilV
MKEKRGSSLLEVIVAVALLAIVVLTVVGGIGMARQSVLNNNVQDDYTAKAQNIADTLITYLSAQDPSKDTVGNEQAKIDEMNKLTGAVHVNSSSDFSSSNTNKEQFTYTWVGVENNPISGYKIEVRVYYNSGKEKKYSTFTAFAACTGGAFNDSSE